MSQLTTEQLMLVFGPDESPDPVYQPRRLPLYLDEDEEYTLYNLVRTDLDREYGSSEVTEDAADSIMDTVLKFFKDKGA